ncbi:MAG TPA: hypothetical protein VFZ65_22220 [Planctomycetota bacterium]|nr:hypothetical protein [Planctomycetota bacterium]
MKSASSAAVARPSPKADGSAERAGHAAPVRRPLAAIPFVLSLLLFAFLALPRVHGNVHMFWAFAGTASCLVLWQVVLWSWARARRRPLQVEFTPPVRQHYIQACVQLVLYAFWGYFWQQDGMRPIYAQVPLIVAQAFFVYAFDGLFAWSRGRVWRLSSGPMPIVLSTNLFIWFRDDWFVWQFVMITIGLLGKEFVKWHKDGRRTHIFNPSGFGLAVVATVLIATGTTDLTWAKPLATTIEVPHIFLVLFLLGLVVQYFFAVTLMTFAAALVMVAINVAYTQSTGVYLFASTNLPAAAFLGLHLLMTDPSTSPRTNVGRTIFGGLYGLGYVVLFDLLGRIGAPELFAKLYPVPILNCCVQVFDRLARAGFVGRLEAAWQRRPKAANLVHMAAWSSVFFVLFGTGYFDRPHPGDSIPFWKQALALGKPDAGRKLVMVTGSKAVAGHSPDALNELGLIALDGKVDEADARTRAKSAANWFAQAAALGSLDGAENLVMHFLFDGVHRSDEDLARALVRLEHQVEAPDGARAAYLLGLASETGGARPVDPRQALALYRRSAADPTFASFAQKGIVRIVLQHGPSIDLTAAVPMLTASAAAGDGESCYYLAYLHELGRAVAPDHERGRQLLQRAGELGFEPAAAALRASDEKGPLPPFQPPRRKFMVRPPWSSAFPP